ncbi:uncharacterized protein C11orf24 homolog isoform X1 [Monodelphis domestica]|uniref:uncharacterized protein C11orf24 homolog isoform X1 n=1 Tax=Monodelphis domestica TaxID=13616 RepID=UPI0024E26CA3|nr:uncharacterized protein C11orf24 homolog isoform X1 [Monodelphis domestica]XP_007505712.2 uncharacterized protein C11orf24 homolog isoform X1 [Monodelphis domestica]XP_056657165.1 uncharacterized protein C11orf24 homolog isoform X1 [Monodelphis domestica]
MWAALVLLFLSSSSVAEKQTPSLGESRARVYRVITVRNQEQCRQACRDPAASGRLFCSWSPMEPSRCVVLACPRIAGCQHAGPRGVQELLPEPALLRVRRNSLAKRRSVPSPPEEAPASSPPKEASSSPPEEAPAGSPPKGVPTGSPPSQNVSMAAESSPTTPLFVVTSGNPPETGTTAVSASGASQGTISAASSHSSPGATLGLVQAAPTGTASAPPTPQVQGTTEKTSLAAAEMTPSVPRVEAATALPTTHSQTSGRQNASGASAEVTVTGPMVVSSPAPLPTRSGVSPTAGRQTPARDGSTDAPPRPETPTPAPPTPLLPLAGTFMSASPGAPPEPAATPPRATAPKATAAPPTSEPERGLPPTMPPSPAAPPGPSRSSPTVPQASAPPGTESQYVRIATSPLSQYLVNQNLLLAVLVVGTIFFLSVLVLLAVQAYESYRKKDYTQVDYLINGMYADSDM